MKPIPLSLYIHIPWCERKCPYCDFNSHQVRSDINEVAYVTALIDDLDADIAKFGKVITGREIESIFIGGGTPSLFSAVSYQTLFSELQQRLTFSKQIEITLEANPGSSETNKFAGFRKAGINRLSIGVQSFNQNHLSALGRIHNPNDAINAAKFAKNAGFDNVNLDLMFGLPQQSVEQALCDLDQALELTPSHLSCYQLTIEPNTLFHHKPPITPDDETLWEMQDQLQHRLSGDGYQQYEVSAYAKADRQCRHNLNYWQFGDYLGIGAGAHGKLTHHSKVLRTWKIKHPNTYLENINKLGGEDQIELRLLPFEFMMNALRLNNGFTFKQFNERTLLPPQAIQTLLEKHQNLKLIEQTKIGIKPTQFGHNMLNSMLEDYLALQL